MDPVEKLLENTGLSVDDLLERLQKYKSLKEKQSNDCDTNKFSLNYAKNSLIEEQSLKNDFNIEIGTDDKDQEIEDNIKSPNSKSSENCLDTSKISFSSNTKNSTKDEVLSELKDNLQINEDTRKIENSTTPYRDTEDSSKTDDDFFELQLAVKDQIDEFESSDESNESSKQDNTKTNSISETSGEEKPNTPLPSNDIRDYLKKQLTSLRNKRKVEKYLPDLEQKTSSISFTNLKRKPLKIASIRSSLESGENISESSQIQKDDNEQEKERKEPGIMKDDLKEQNDEKIEDTIKENSSPTKFSFNFNKEQNELVSCSNETNLVISAVFGGVDDLPDEPKRNKIVDRLIDSFLRQDKDLVNIEESNDIDVGVDTPVTISQSTGSGSLNDTQDKSPFVSDSLDDFLNKGSSLKISYTVPKLGAEEGLKENNKESLLKLVLEKPTSEILNNSRSGIFSHIKAKTLAEKRRIMESNNLINYVRRPTFVLYNKKKIWVRTRTKSNSEQCIANIVHKKYKYPSFTSTEKKCLPKKEKRKPSLLQSVWNEKVSYKPGPLCKKASLINSTSWLTEVRDLPKMFLEVTPEIGKPISNDVRHLIPLNPIISKEQANFALSTLITKDKKPELEVFKFPVQYINNQEKIILRKPLVKLEQPEEVPSFQEDDSESVIRKIVDNLINYVEVKMIESSLIKDDEDIELELKEESKLPLLRQRKKPLKNKLKSELARLSCQIITVEPDDETDDLNCEKPFCTLGCVCKSISFQQIVPTHCGKPKCMFECKCAPESVNKYLSSHTFSQIDDVAKRNLAKVEREFTQTVIHKGNDTIVVGSTTGTSRRTCKAPKKYGDYIDFNEDEALDRPSSIMFNLKPCSVPLEKLNLDDLIPYCLTHSAYDCFCKGRTSFTAPVVKQKKDEDPLVLFKEEIYNNIKNIQALERIRSTTRKIKKPNILDYEYEEPLKRFKDDSCARVRPIFSEYFYRNREPQYKTKLVRWAKKQKETSTIFLRTEDNNRLLDINQVEPEINSTKIGSNKPNKRKQSFDCIRTDSHRSLLKQNTNNKTTQTTNDLKDKPFVPKPWQMRKTFKKNHYETIFEGEIKVDLHDNQEFSKIVGEENLAYLRLLPWSLLIKSYKNKELFVCCSKTENVLLVGKTYQFPLNFIPIEMSQRKNQIINWILNDRLPPDKPSALLHIILKPTLSPNFYVMSGFCLKNQTVSDLKSKIRSMQSKGPSSEATLSLPTKTIATTTTTQFENNPQIHLPSSLSSSSSLSTSKIIGDNSFEQNEKLILPSSLKMPPARNITCSHQTKNNEIKFLLLITKEYEKRLFITKDNRKLYLPLPYTTRTARWKVISLDIEFSYLKFGLSKYTIQYSDLLDLLNMASNIKRTICVRSNEFVSKFSKKSITFGIYFVPNAKNIILLGPYNYKDEDMVTLLNCVVGSQKSKKQFYWIYEKSKTVNVTNEELEKIQESQNFIPLQKTIDESDQKSIELKKRIFVRKKPSISIIKSSLENYDLPIVKKIIKNSKDEVMDLDEEDPLKIESSSSQQLSDVETIDVEVNDDDDNNKSDNKSECNKVETTVNVYSGKIPLNFQPVIKAINYPEPKNFMKETIFCTPFVFEIKRICSAKYNRYISSNIPKLGYLVGYQEPKSHFIDILWPTIDKDVNKCYRFPSTKFAIDAIAHYLSLIYCPVERDFKIEVEISESYVLNKHYNNISPENLTEEYVCGSFGYFKKSAIPGFIKERCKLTPENLLKFEKKQNRDCEKRLVHLTALFLMSPSDYQQNLTKDDILNWAVLECSKLKTTFNNINKKRASLIKTKRNYLSQLKKIMSELPTNMAVQEYEKLSTILNSKVVPNIMANGSQSNEPSDFIEIDDSSGDESKDKPEIRNISENKDESSKDLNVESDLMDTSSSSSNKQCSNEDKFKKLEGLESKNIPLPIKLNDGDLTITPTTSACNTPPSLINSNDLKTQKVTIQKVTQYAMYNGRYIKIEQKLLN